jgi:peptidoglycan/xylan/chitin deacetylase (PgdA/CDA1 family)
MSGWRSAAKRTLLGAGHYRRRLRAVPFPGLAVLCYHAVRPDGWPDGRMAFEGLHVRAAELDAHCRVLRSMCEPVTFERWRAALDGGPPLPPRAVLVTFDDGYGTVATVAQPILARHAVPFVVFACTDPIEAGTYFWYDAVALRDGEEEVQRLKQAPFAEWAAAVRRADRAVPDGDPHAPLTPDQVRELSRRGVEVGGHTASHPILARADRAEQLRQILRNRDALEAWTARPAAAFAYPNGERSDYSADTVSILREAGFAAAFTTESGFASLDRRFECPRFLMLAGVSDAELAHRLSYSWRR